MEKEIEKQLLKEINQDDDAEELEALSYILEHGEKKEEYETVIAEIKNRISIILQKRKGNYSDMK